MPVPNRRPRAPSRHPVFGLRQKPTVAYARFESNNAYATPPIRQICPDPHATYPESARRRADTTATSLALSPIRFFPSATRREKPYLLSGFTDTLISGGVASTAEKNGYQEGLLLFVLFVLKVSRVWFDPSEFIT